jgi:hypothetical protein
MWGGKVQLHPFLTSLLYRDYRAVHLGHFTHWPQLIWGLVGDRAESLATAENWTQDLPAHILVTIPAELPLPPLKYVSFLSVCFLTKWTGFTLLVLLQDWWTASSQAAYFRSWNIVVHDWLYTYIYRDFIEILIPGKRFYQAVVVFTISAIFHEYVLACTFRFFYPMMFVAFGGLVGV